MSPEASSSSAAPHFRALAEAGLSAWSKPTRFPLVEAMGVLPLADTEVLHMSHYAPIAIALDECGPQVVAIVRPDLLTGRQFNAEGRWLPSYAPMAMRCLPFRTRPGKNDLEVARELCDPDADKAIMLYDAQGKAAAEFAAVLDLLGKLSRGGQRLADAAKLLFAADVLIPLHPLEDRPNETLFVASAEKILALAPAQAAALTASSNLPFELAAASVFSLRWLDRKHIQEVIAASSAQSVGSRAPLLEFDGNDALDQPLLMDDSALFSIEAFLEAVGTEK